MLPATGTTGRWLCMGPSHDQHAGPVDVIRRAGSCQKCYGVTDDLTQIFCPGGACQMGRLAGEFCAGLRRSVSHEPASHDNMVSRANWFVGLACDDRVRLRNRSSHHSGPRAPPALAVDTNRLERLCSARHLRCKRLR